MIDYDAYNSAELAEIYDAVYADRDDHAFWTALAPDDGAILELACGTGRVLLPLARAGHEIVGLDLSAQMLDRCRAALSGQPDEVRRRVALVQADMTSFALDRRFALVTSPYRGFARRPPAAPPAARHCAAASGQSLPPARRNAPRRRDPHDRRGHGSR